MAAGRGSWKIGGCAGHPGVSLDPDYPAGPQKADMLSGLRKLRRQPTVDQSDPELERKSINYENFYNSWQVGKAWILTGHLPRSSLKFLILFSLALDGLQQ